MKRFPPEFEALLSPAGRRLLKGKHRAHGALLRGAFFSSAELVDLEQFPRCANLLAKTFNDLLDEVGRPLPPANASKEQFEDNLPKVGRVQTVSIFEGPRHELAVQRSKEIGLHQMLHSDSFRAFCEALAGEKLDGPQATQVLCYRPGDYAGPHTDNHPDDPRAAGGYVDVHVTITTGGVKDQFIVYERDGHLTEQQSIAANGTVTAYRLPVWHYTTPLITRTPKDRRWLLLGSYVYERTREAARPPSTDFEAALASVMLKVSSLASSAAPSPSSESPPSGSAPGRQSGDS